MPAKSTQQPPTQMYPVFRRNLSCRGGSFELRTDVGLATKLTTLNDSIKCAGSLPWRLSELQRQKHDALKQSVPMLPQIHAINAPSVKQGLSSVQCGLETVPFAPPPTQRESCGKAACRRTEVPVSKGMGEA